MKKLRFNNFCLCFHRFTFISCLLFLLPAVELKLPAAQFPLGTFAIKDQLDLSGEWLFRDDTTSNTGIQDEWFLPDCNRGDWKKIQVPGVWDMAPGKLKRPIKLGIGWYYREINIPKNYTADLTLAFLGSMYITDVWANGEYLGVHRGGYSPFWFELVDIAGPGETLHIVARADNRIGIRTIPAYAMGWDPYGGLYREVFLLNQPKVRVEEIKTVCKIQPDQSAVLKVEGTMRNFTSQAFMHNLQVELMDGKNRIMGDALKLSVPADDEEQFLVEWEIPNAHLWSPDDPFLYQLHFMWSDHPGDSITLPIGLREIRTDGHKLLLNNKRLWLQGFAMHEEAPKRGPIVPLQRRREQLVNMKKYFNANYIRPGHYPNHPEFYKLCDELGLLVWAEIPVWWANYQPDQRQYSDFIHTDKAWDIWLEPQLTEMVQTLRHFTSVCFYGISNETHGMHQYYKRARALVKSLDTTRLVQPAHTSTSDLPGFQYSDIGARNLYYGWYHSRSVYDARYYFPKLIKWLGEKPMLLTEIGCKSRVGDFSGDYGGRSKFSATYADKVTRFAFQYYMTYSDKLTGVTFWTWADFNRFNRSHIEDLGILSEGLQPKPIAYTIANLFRGNFRLFIVENHSFVRSGKNWQADLFSFNAQEKQFGKLKARWSILHGKELLARNEFEFTPSNKRSEKLNRISWPVPQNAKPGMYSCWIEVYDEKGSWVYTNGSFFDVNSYSKSGIFQVDARQNGKPISGAWMELNGIRIPIYEFPGLLIALPAGEYQLIFHAESMKSVQKTIKIISTEKTKQAIDFQPE